jgi:hypothetical protein
MATQPAAGSIADAQRRRTGTRSEWSRAATTADIYDGRHAREMQRKTRRLEGFGRAVT